MAENLVQNLLILLDGFKNIQFGREISVFIISLMPILELRGGLMAAYMLGISPLLSFAICVIGNLLPVPFIVMFITPIFEKLKKTKAFSGLIKKIEMKANNKKSKVENYEFLGLILFVGIPLPGTGAWTGALIASMLDMNKKKAMFAITLGVLMAGIIMMIFSFGILRLIFK